MDVRTNREYLAYLLEQLIEFQATFEDFMQLHVEWTGTGRGLLPAVAPREGADPERIRDLTAKLNLLSGRLMELSSVTDVKLGVEGQSRPIDPFVNWEQITTPRPLLEPSTVRMTCKQAQGRLEGLSARAKAMASPEIEPSRLHPVVWSTAQRLWNDGHLRLAVAAAAEAVTGQMKQLTRRNDAADTTLWQQAFSERPPEVGKSRLRWPGDPTDQGVKTMNDGLRQFAPGVNMVIRNPATHTDEEIAEQDALEKLAVLSSLMRFVDRCEVAAAPVDRAPATTER